MKKHVGLLMLAPSFALFLGTLVWALTHPAGLAVAKRAIQDVRRMQQDTDGLLQRVDRTRKHVERLRSDPEERKRAVRQHLNKALPGETTIILPEGKPAGAPADAR